MEEWLFLLVFRTRKLLCLKHIRIATKTNIQAMTTIKATRTKTTTATTATTTIKTLKTTTLMTPIKTVQTNNITEVWILLLLNGCRVQDVKK